ncbi:Uncharacterized protein DBV15_02078 [Temnothorax longispinosus]|uniref:Uncharacterized protein n=1 Tax=Temnothorax longispinosus TaxID=300112 RepID=A0A4S2KQ97_9HYME|nr:Uncharacterized protein DBV15_02078 [Temnothorax longispinosus]
MKSQWSSLAGSLETRGILVRNALIERLFRQTQSLHVKEFGSFMAELSHEDPLINMFNASIYIPANILPVECGGTDSTIQELTEYWKKLIEEN